MAMEYGKRFITNKFSVKSGLFTLMVSVVFCLTACVTQSGKPERSGSMASNSNSEPPVRKAVLNDSLAYLPKRVKDEQTREYVRYLKAINPYEAQKGQVEASSVVNFVKARRKFQQKDYVAAEILLKQITDTNHKISGPWVMRGDVAHKQNNIQLSEQYYRKAISINVDNINAYIRLATVLRIQGQFIQAQNVYVDVLNQWRDFPEAHLNLSILYDIYLNKIVLAQRHLEAYQFLTSGKDKQASQWLKELRQRTGEPVVLQVELTKAVTATTEKN